jgi:hypothetical protein
MKLTLETNIGTVTYELDGHFVHVFTEQDGAREFSLNLWNHETRELRIQTSIDDVFLEVADALNEKFPGFQVGSLVVDFAPLEKMVASTLIKAYVQATKKMLGG